MTAAFAEQNTNASMHSADARLRHARLPSRLHFGMLAEPAAEPPSAARHSSRQAEGLR
jgi:hypothetical protein